MENKNISNNWENLKGKSLRIHVPENDDDYIIGDFVGVEYYPSITFILIYEAQKENDSFKEKIKKAKRVNVEKIISFEENEA